MLSIAHTLISLPFGVFMENPYLIFAAAFVMHLFSDTLLHWNTYEGYHRPFVLLAALDVVSGVGLAWLLVGPNVATLPVLAAIAGGNFPDILHAVWNRVPTSWRIAYLAPVAPWFRFHDALQLETIRPLPGLVSQLLLGGAAVVLVLIAR